MPLGDCKRETVIRTTVSRVSVVFLAIITITAGANFSAKAQGSKSKADAKSGSSRDGKIDAQQLVRETVQNELNSGKNDPSLVEIPQNYGEGRQETDVRRNRNKERRSRPPACGEWQVFERRATAR